MVDTQKVAAQIVGGAMTVMGFLIEFLGWGSFILAIVVTGIGIAVLSWFHDVGENDGDSNLAKIIDLLRAGVFVTLVVVLFLWVDSPAELLQLWWIVPVLIAGYMAYLYMQESRDKASTETAFRGVRRRLEKNTKKTVAVVGGGVVSVVAIGTGAWQGLSGALSSLGDVLQPFIGEIAFAITNAVAYVGLGGFVPFLSGIIEPFTPISPLQYLIIAATLTAIALLFRD